MTLEIPHTYKNISGLSKTVVEYLNKNPNTIGNHSVDTASQQQLQSNMHFDDRLRTVLRVNGIKRPKHINATNSKKRRGIRGKY